jgi:fructokinase
MYKAICFGEVLWDIFPTYKNIGGAPLNVALRLQSFGIDTSIISCIGEDDNGKEILQYINTKGVDTSNIQFDEIHKTGRVNVALDQYGSATYEIEYPVAWDKIAVTENGIGSVKASDAFIFGSLACRDDVTKSTLLDLIQYSSYTVFDVNLRPPHYTIDLIIALMNRSDFIKCNDDELIEICAALNFKSESIEEQIKFLSRHTKTEQICITKGKDGAIMLYNNQYYSNNGYEIKVADTVGAGDSFLATLIYNLLDKKDTHDALSHACAVGAVVASKEGANPLVSEDEISETILNS